MAQKASAQVRSEAGYEESAKPRPISRFITLARHCIARERERRVQLVAPAEGSRASESSSETD
jgi:hypothetical protein